MIISGRLGEALRFTKSVFTRTHGSRPDGQPRPALPQGHHRRGRNPIRFRVHDVLIEMIDGDGLECQP